MNVFRIARLAVAVVPLLGCAADSRQTVSHTARDTSERFARTDAAELVQPPVMPASGNDGVKQVSLQTTEPPPGPPEPTSPAAPDNPSESTSAPPEDFVVGAALPLDETRGEPAASDLTELEALALAQNPAIIRMKREHQAALARVGHVGALPDPMLGANVFGHPIETAAGSQRANLSVQQLIPWIDRLHAREQQACFEASAREQRIRTEENRVIAGVRSAYYRIYVLGRQLAAIEANKEWLGTLLELVAARIADGKGTRGDVLLGTVELSRLEEQRLSVEQQIQSQTAELNRLVGRAVDVAIEPAVQIDPESPELEHAALFEACRQHQPELVAAHLMANASRWGVDVAELQRRPDVQVGAAWYLIDDNRPASSVVDIGRDAWSIGAAVTIPLDRLKYDSLRDEAAWKHAAANSAVKDLEQKFSARLLDLISQARTAAETAALYQKTILPQARDTLEADQESLGLGAVEFDRVIQDLRSLLLLEVGYHQAVGRHAISVAKLREATGKLP